MYVAAILELLLFLERKCYCVSQKVGWLHDMATKNSRSLGTGQIHMSPMRVMVGGVMVEQKL